MTTLRRPISRVRREYASAREASNLLGPVVVLCIGGCVLIALTGSGDGALRALSQLVFWTTILAVLEVCVLVRRARHRRILRDHDEFWGENA